MSSNVCHQIIYLAIELSSSSWVIAYRVPRNDKARCLVPGFDGASLSNDWKDALWARFFMGAPRRQSGCVPRQAFRGRHGV